ncbi:MAG TPA: YdcF family protein, partial [Hyphomicrobiaceae bacterium]|nr:YdcF family protein [Hyphomicrobiaceae bacterium]
LGGGNPLSGAHVAEAEATARALDQLGVDRRRMTLETGSRTTWENAVLGVPAIGARPGERWVLVTSAFHMPRAVGVFRTVGLDVVPFPVDYQTSKNIDVWRLKMSFSDGLGMFDGYLREYPALVYYRLLGRTDALFPAPR